VSNIVIIPFRSTTISLELNISSAQMNAGETTLNELLSFVLPVCLKLIPLARSIEEFEFKMKYDIEVEPKNKI
jgi:hypothetical protein